MHQMNIRLSSKSLLKQFIDVTVCMYIICITTLVVYID